ncbi:MAG: flagellar basal-body MS-ring/collar protein FliF [Sedimentitalea sp.]
MQQIKNIWTGLDAQKQLIFVLAIVAMIVTLVAMSRMASSPSLTLLYSGLEPAAAGDVVRSLEQQGAAYEVRGDSIYVASNRRDEMRMTLASEGLPMNGGRGYELLDSLSGFGTTSQMFDAAYWRAKEGELARTIVASAHISQARVHIANNGSNPFQRTVEPTASISVVPAGIPLTSAQANALRFLVASAVAGMPVENVAVIDGNGALIGTSDTATSPNSGDDRAKLLRERVTRLVEARVGLGNAIVEVSVDTVTETESIRERRFDPEGRVAISTDTEERSDSSSNQGGGDVTVASNLPDGDAAEGEGSSARGSETRERVNYEVSETEHEIIRAPGAIKRLTVAVLVDGLRTPNADGTIAFSERPETELAALRDLVSAAVGFQEDRGDVITLKSMDLPATEPLGTAASPSLLQSFNLDIMSLIQMAVLGVVALILGLFVVRPILAKPAALPGSELAALPGVAAADSPALTGEIDMGEGFGAPGGMMGMGSGFGQASLDDLADDPVDRLRSMIGDRQEETVEILRSWLEESEENA